MEQKKPDLLRSALAKASIESISLADFASEVLDLVEDSVVGENDLERQKALERKLQAMLINRVSGDQQ